MNVRDCRMDAYVRSYCDSVPTNTGSSGYMSVADGMTGDIPEIG